MIGQVTDDRPGPPGAGRLAHGPGWLTGRAGSRAGLAHGPGWLTAQGGHQHWGATEQPDNGVRVNLSPGAW
jgi:hypothetical protein